MVEDGARSIILGITSAVGPLDPSSRGACGPGQGALVSRGNFDSRFPELSHWRTAGRWLMWAVPFSIAPLAGSMLMLIVLGEGASVPDLIADGQLGLYAATVVGVTAYICAIDRESTAMRWRTGLLWLSFIIIVVDVVIYTTVQIVDILSNNFGSTIDFDGAVVALVTSAAYLAALSIAYLANVADGERQSVGISDIRQQQQDRLLEEFREISDD